MDNEVIGNAVTDTVNDQAPIEQQSSSSDTVTTPQVETPKAAKPEKMVPSSQVSKIVAQQAREAADKARREMQAQFDQERASQQTSTPPVTQGMGGMPGADEQSIRKLIREEAWQIANQDLAERIAKDFEAKMDEAKEKYPDFAEKYKALNIERHPELVLWTRELDNVGDVMNDIINNPTKFAQVLMLANSGFPQLAEQELHKLSSSIKANEAAKQSQQAPHPLNQMKSSNIGTDNGEMSVSDFRKQSWMRR